MVMVFVRSFLLFVWICNLKGLILPYYKVNRRYLLIHLGVYHTTAFNYLNNKQHEERKVLALRVVDTLFDKTKHNSYFGKINFGSKQKFRHMKNPTLYLVILTWLQQLQRCFFEKSEQDPAQDWNKYRRYYGTGTCFILGRPGLSNIDMSTVKIGGPAKKMGFFKWSGYQF
jgi:hypothetical protein